MTAPRPRIACLGAGRMGRGIAVAFAYAGHHVTLIDVKPRPADAFATLEAEATGEIGKTLALVGKGLKPASGPQPESRRGQYGAQSRTYWWGAWAGRRPVRWPARTAKAAARFPARRAGTSRGSPREYSDARKRALEARG